MKRLNMFVKSIFGLVLLAVLTSGCLNYNAPSQKTQPIISPTPAPTNKIINLHAQQIILDDTEIKEILGADFTEKNKIISPEVEGNGLHVLSGIDVGYVNLNNAVLIRLNVAATVEDANKLSQAYVLELQKEGIKTIVNKINIGDSAGELYSFVSTQDKNTQTNAGSSLIIFRKNNIIVSVLSTPDVKVEPLLELARKQEEKISKLLDLFSASQDSSSTKVKTPASIQTSTSTTSPAAPTASIVASNLPDTPAVDLKIQHKGGDTLKGGEYMISIVAVGQPPVFIISQPGSDFGVGDEIHTHNTTNYAGATMILTDSGLNSFPAQNPWSQGNKYDVKLVHVPSNAMLVDQVVEVR